MSAQHNRPKPLPQSHLPSFEWRRTGQRTEPFTHASLSTHPGARRRARRSHRSLAVFRSRDAGRVYAHQPVLDDPHGQRAGAAADPGRRHDLCGGDAADVRDRRAVSPRADLDAVRRGANRVCTGRGWLRHQPEPAHGGRPRLHRATAAGGDRLPRDRTDLRSRRHGGDAPRGAAAAGADHRHRPGSSGPGTGPEVDAPQRPRCGRHVPRVDRRRRTRIAGRRPARVFPRPVDHRSGVAPRRPGDHRRRARAARRWRADG